MNEAKQQRQTDDRPVVSPLVNDKTYGERVYHSIFDIGLNYWANLLSSAGFSQWAEHGNGKVPFSDKSPRELQKELANGIIKRDPLMTGLIPFTNVKIPFLKGYADTALKKAAIDFPHEEALNLISISEQMVENRAIARARSLTLLVPGFLIVVPTVWLGAKIKPWFVSKLDQHKYGAGSMDDPTLKARHEAIAAESRPTIFGAVSARLMTMAAVQISAQLVGSKGNFISNNTKYKNFGVNEITDSFGHAVGGALPEKVRENFSKFASKKLELGWSDEQIKKHLKDIGYLRSDSIIPLDAELREKALNGIKDAAGIGQHPVWNEKEQNYLPVSDHQRAEGINGLKEYKTAAQDLGRFIATDTIYTIITACTIQPAIKLLRMIPGMSYKPKTAKDGNDGKVLQPTRVKVPANEFGEFSDRAETVTVQAAKDTTAPGLSINQASPHGTLHQHEQQIA